MIVAVDTNVLVSGLMSALGPSAKIVQRLLQGQLKACYDDRIIAEYWDVLLRPRFPFDPDDVRILIDRIQAEGVPVICQPLQSSLPDPDDNMFIEAALAAEAVCLVTGNLRHFPDPFYGTVEVVSPANFVSRRDFPT